jgi:flagellin
LAINTANNDLAVLGTSQNAVSTTLTFTSNLSNALTQGIGSLVDADVAAESATLQSLQTKQQLGVQALSIANSSSSVLLSLFRG